MKDVDTPAQGEELLVDADQGPMDDPDEARDLMEQAWLALRTGAKALAHGQELLATAERRQAWKILGFDSWQHCVVLDWRPTDSHDPNEVMSEPMPQSAGRGTHLGEGHPEGGSSRDRH